MTEFQHGGLKCQLMESELGRQDGKPLGLEGDFPGRGNGNGGHKAQPTPRGRWGSFPHEPAEGNNHGRLWGGNGPTNLPANQPRFQSGAAGPARSCSAFGDGYKHATGPVSHSAGMPIGGASAGSLPLAPPGFLWAPSADPATGCALVRSSSASPEFLSAPGVGPAPEATTRPNSAAPGGAPAPYSAWSVGGPTDLKGEYGSHIKLPQDVSPRPDMNDESASTSDNGSSVFGGSDGIWEDYTNSVIHEGVLVRESGDLMRLSTMPPEFDPTSAQSAASTYQAMAASSEEFESHFLERSQALRAYSYSRPSTCRPGANLKVQAPLATAIARRMGALSDENQELRNLTWGGAGTARCHPEGGLELQRLQEQLEKVRDFNQSAGVAIKELARELQEANRALGKACGQIELLGGVNGASGTEILENIQKGYAPPREMMIGGRKYVAVGKVAGAAAQTKTQASSPEAGNQNLGGPKTPAPKNSVRGRGGRGFRGRSQT